MRSGLNTAKMTVLACLLTSMAMPANSQTLDTNTGQFLAQAPCEIWAGFSNAGLTDGNVETAWGSQHRSGPCHLIFRFDEPVAVSAVRFSNAPTNDWRSPAPRAVIWASHQDFGRGFFRVGEDSLAPEGETLLALDEPVLARTIKVSITPEDPYQSGTFGPQLRELEFVFEDAEGVTRWPMPPLPEMQNADPIVGSGATECDAIAGFPFNPDNYGYGREDLDIDVGEAVLACQRAVALNPDSPRLITNLARAESLAEQAIQSVSRLADEALSDYPPAQYLLAAAFEDGLGVEMDEARALELYQASAAAGFLPAIAWLVEREEEELAERLANDDSSVSDDLLTLSDSLKLLVDQRYPQTIQTYTRFLLRSDESQIRANLPIIEEAAEYGADAGFAPLIWNGYHGIPRNLARSNRWTLERIERAPEAYMFGNLVVGEGRSAAGWRWGRQGAYSFDTWALAKFAELYNDGTEDAERIDRLTFASALESVENGNHDYMYELGQMYLEGRGTEQDRPLGARWIVRAADSGHSLALRELQTNPGLRELAEQDQ